MNDTEWHKKSQAIAVSFAASMDLNFRATVQKMVKSYPLAPNQEAAEFVLNVMMDALVSGTSHVVAAHTNLDLATEELFVKQIRQKFKDMRSAVLRQKLAGGAVQ